MKYKSGSPPNQFTYKAAMVIICEVGFGYTDLTDENDMNCSSTGKWTSIPSCLGLNFKFPV